jgi:predicted RNA binding protein YcfA (HicA-like mRNA interferase family)
MPYKYNEIERKLSKLGFIIKRHTKGSYVIFQKDEKILVIPKHSNKDISIGVEKTIYKVTNLSPEEFRSI